MAFKYQKLTKEEAEYINSFKIPYPYGGGNVLLEFDYDDLTYIDRERKIYYVIAGGLGELEIENCLPMVNYLIMEDELIRFTCYSKYELNSDGKAEYIYNIDTIRVPLSIKEKMDKKIIEIIKEALEERMIRYDGDDYGSMKFYEIAQPWYTDMDPRI